MKKCAGTGSLLVAAMLGAQAEAASAEPASAPVTLVAETEGGAVLLRVVGEASTSVSVDYALEVTSGAWPGGNHSLQRGSARLSPNKRVVLLTAKLGGAAAGHWRARLHVTADGAAYDLERSAAD